MTQLSVGEGRDAASRRQRPELAFSFVIPTYNEAEDIEATLDAALNQDVSPTEVIVIDGGSTDGTLDILWRRAAADPRVRVIEEGRRRGVAAARNTGLRAATGDIFVILNADVSPEPDFLRRLAPLYREGYDCVSVESRVANVESVFGRFVQADHEEVYGGNRRGNVGWTEGFSCRREAALAALFPEEIPGMGGEDVVFTQRLLERGCAWKGDFSIVVPHRVPAAWRGFWRQWRWRGNAVPYAEARLRGRSLAMTTLRRVLASAWSLAVAALIAPNAIAVARRARRSARGWRDLPAFWALYHVRTLAHRAGEWETLVRLWLTNDHAT